MAQADGYIRISTLNDTTQAQRSIEQLGDTLASALDTSLADRMTDAVTDLGDALRDAGGSATELRDVQHGIDDVGNSATTTGKLIRTHLISDTVMKGLKQLGSVLKSTAVSAVSGAISNEEAFAKVSTLLTGNDLEKYLEGLIDISNRTGVTLKDLAESMYSSLSAGVAQENVLEFVENSVKLAKGGFTETATAIDVVTTAINAYHMEMEDATHIQDVLITTQNKGKTTVGELAQYMGKVIPTANSVNVEFDQLGALFATMTANISSTADATTYLNSMINELGSSGSTAEKALMAATEGTALAGKKFSEISAMGYDVTDVLTLMSDEAAKSGKSLADMFSSSEASKAANILLSDMNGFKQNIEAMADSTGAAATAANTVMDTTAEKVQVAKNQIDNLTTSIAQSLLPVIGEAAEEVSGAVAAADVSEIASDLGKFISGTLSLLLKNIKLIGSALAGVTTSVVIYKSLMSAAKSITDFKGSVKSLATAFGILRTSTDSATVSQEANNAAAAANPYMAVIAAISLVIGGVVTLAGQMDSCNDKMRGLIQNADKLIDSSKEYKEKSEGLKDIKKRYEDISLSTDSAIDKNTELQALQDDLISQFGGVADGIDLVTGAYDDLIESLDNAIEKTDEFSQTNAKLAALDTAAAEKEKTAIKLGIALGDNGIAGQFALDYAKKYLKTFSAANTDITPDDFIPVYGAINNVAAGANRTLYFEGSYENKINDLKRLQRALVDEFEKTGKTEYSKIAHTVDEQISVLMEGAEKFIKAEEALNSVSNELSEMSDNNSVNSSGSATAVEEERKGKEAEQKRKARLAQLDEEKAANVELYNHLRADAKYSYDMGVIDAAEYYSQLAELRDSYLEEDTEEWRSVNVEIKKYYDSLTEEQKKAYETLLKQQKEAAEQAQRERLASYNEEKSQLQFKQKTGQISEKQYYEELANIRDKYLDKNSAEWRNSFLETYQYNQKIIEANKDALNALLTETSDSTLSALQNIISARDSLTSKLVDFNKTFEKITETVPETVAVKGEFTVTTAEHEIETYRMGADSIEDNIKILEEYGEMLDALKARGADDGTLNDILAMDIDEAMEFGSKMLKMSDREWNGYFDSMARLRETAADISAKYYQSEVDNLKNNFVDRLREELFGLEGDMLNIGAEAAMSFISGWNEAIGANDLTLSDMLYSLAGGSYTTAPKMAQLLSGFGATIGSSEKVKTDSGTTIMPIYIGGEKLTDIVIEGINSKNIKVGKNVLNT